MRQWVAAHQDLLSDYDADIEQIRQSHRITEATGDDLGEIGESFGRIGVRRGRGDEEYRQLLMSIDSAFGGRGTPRGVRFAVGAGVRADPDEEVTITEYFDQLAYSLAIENWTGHRVSTVHELADLADPSGVQLNPPIVYDSPAVNAGYNASDTVSGTVVTSPEADVAFGAGDTQTSIERAGAGAGRFDGLDEFGEGEQLGDEFDEGEDSFGQSSYSEFSYGESTAPSSTTGAQSSGETEDDSDAEDADADERSGDESDSGSESDSDTP